MAALDVIRSLVQAAGRGALQNHNVATLGPDFRERVERLKLQREAERRAGEVHTREVGALDRAAAEAKLKERVRAVRYGEDPAAGMAEEEEALQDLAVRGKETDIAQGEESVAASRANRGPKRIGDAAASALFGKPTPGGEFGKEELDILGDSMQAREGRKTAYGVASIRDKNDRANPADPQIQGAIKSVADRYARGEITFQNALSALGGVHSGLQPAFLKEVGNRVGLPKEVRAQVQGIRQGQEVVNQIRQMAAGIVSIADPVERTKRSMLLDNFVQSKAAVIARGFSGEKGTLSQGDVSRATSIMPGWKAANFSPDFLERELKVMEQGFNLQEQAAIEGYFRTASVGEGGGVGLDGVPPPSAQTTAPAGTKRYKYRGQEVSFEQLPPDVQAKVKARGL